MKYTVYIFSIILLFSSCVSTKPDSGYVSEQDYNLRRQVKDAHFRKKMNIIGASTIVIGAGAGAYYGYNTNLIKQQKGSETVVVKPANAVIGGLVGLSVTTLGNYLVGRNKKVPCKSPQQWINKSNKGYLYLGGDNANFRVIHKSAESNFSVKNYSDFNDFMTAFPNSGSKDKIILATANNVVSRAELNTIIQKFPASPSTTQLKKEYVSRSSTIIDLFDASEKYPETNLNVEELGSNLVNSVSNLQLFYKKFPNSVYLEQLLEKVTHSASFSELELFISNNSGFPKIERAKYWCIVKSPSIASAKQKFAQYTGVVSEVEVQEIAWKLVGTDFTQAKEFAKTFSSSKYIKKYGNEDTYIGFTLNGKRDGYGFIIGKNDYTFKGNWKNDLKNGYGEEVIADIGYYYKGYFVNDNYEGQGEQKRGNADYYTGGFKNGERHGQGVLTFDTDRAGKATQKGNFVDGYMTGQGRVDFSNGEWYEGSFKDGQAHGYGEYRTKEGYRLTGRYDMGLRIGKHSYRKFILGGLVDTEKGEIDYGSGEGMPSVKETYNIFNERLEERREAEVQVEEEEKEIDYENVEHPGVEEYGKWEDSPNSDDERQYIEFKDGKSGYIFNDDDGDGFHISDLGIRDYYYKTYEATIRALYVMKKYGRIIKRDRK